MKLQSNTLSQLTCFPFLLIFSGSQILHSVICCFDSYGTSNQSSISFSLTPTQSSETHCFCLICWLCDVVYVKPKISSFRVAYPPFLSINTRNLTDLQCMVFIINVDLLIRVFLESTINSDVERDKRFQNRQNYLAEILFLNKTTYVVCFRHLSRFYLVGKQCLLLVSILSSVSLNKGVCEYITIGSQVL